MVKTTETSVDVRIGANIAAARKDAGLSQTALAQAVTKLSGLEWSERLVARMEAGDRPLRYSEAASLAQALGVPISGFLDGTNTQKSKTAEIGRVGRAMKALTHASHALNEGLNAMAAAQGEYQLAAKAAHSQLRDTWSDAELDAVRDFVRLAWDDAARYAKQHRDSPQLPGTKPDA